MDRILGHPGSVNCIEKYDENTLISGCEDRGVRFVSISPKGINMLISDKTKPKVENGSFKDITAISLNSNKMLVSLFEYQLCKSIGY